jgi:hypothetical protein
MYVRACHYVSPKLYDLLIAAIRTSEVQAILTMPCTKWVSEHFCDDMDSNNTYIYKDHNYACGMYNSMAAARYLHSIYTVILIPVTTRSKAWVFGHSLAGNVGSNVAGGMDVCHLWVLYVVR